MQAETRIITIRGKRIRRNAKGDRILQKEKNQSSGDSGLTLSDNMKRTKNMHSTPKYIKALEEQEH